MNKKNQNRFADVLVMMVAVLMLAVSVIIPIGYLKIQESKIQKLDNRAIEKVENYVIEVANLPKAQLYCKEALFKKDIECVVTSDVQKNPELVKAMQEVEKEVAMGGAIINGTFIPQYYSIDGESTKLQKLLEQMVQITIIDKNDGQKYFVQPTFVVEDIVGYRIALRFTIPK